MNRLQQEAAKADPSKDLAILEDPKVKDHLDSMLSSKLTPKIWDMLRATGYRVEPEVPKITSERSYALTRAVRFLLFDYLQYPFLIGDFAVKEEGWMFTRTFSLGLSKDTKPEILLSLIRDERFVGIPPTIHVEESSIYPDWDIHFIVTFKTGSRASWDLLQTGQFAISAIQQVVDASREMVNIAMNDKLASQTDAKQFLKVAATAFGAA